MFPLHDVHKPAKTPVVTRLLILANVVAFIYQTLVGLTGKGHSLAYLWGVRPNCYFSPGACGIDLPEQSQLLWKPLLTSLFLHADILHLAFNMLFLWVFGAGIEDRLGRLRFMLLFFGCGIAATLAHIVTHPLSPVPVIGASGAIAGVLGAYFVLLPRSWILTYFPPIFLFPVPAPLFLLLWIALQVLSAVTHLPFLSSNGQGSDIAWMAHIGGFACGAAVGWAVKPWWKKTRTASPATVR